MNVRFFHSPYVTPSMFEGALDFEGETWRIRQDGYLWQGDEY